MERGANRPTEVQYEKAQTRPRRSEEDIIDINMRLSIEAGHNVEKRGKFYTCTECRVTRKSCQDNWWFNEKCVGRPLNKRTMGWQHIEIKNITQDKIGPRQTCTGSRAKAREVTRTQAKEERRRNAEENAQHERARAQAHRDTQWEKLQTVEDGRHDGSDTRLERHESHHKVVICRGYVGCLECGRIASTNTESNQLNQECRKNFPKDRNGRVRMLIRGEHPQKIKGRPHTWPSGEEAPQPKRLKESRSETVNLAGSSYNAPEEEQEGAEPHELGTQAAPEPKRAKFETHE
jgi:hypothetical protein